MATTHRDLKPDEVTNLTSVLSLTENLNYTLQAQGGDIYLAEASSEPQLSTNPAAFILSPRKSKDYQQGSENLYAWGRGRITVFDAV